MSNRVTDLGKYLFLRLKNYIILRTIMWSNKHEHFAFKK